MSACHIPPKDKKKLGQKVGAELIRKYGRKKHYTIGEVKSSMSEMGFPLDVHCWGLALFASPFDFENYHNALGQDCDLVSMKSEMVSAMTMSDVDSWFNVDMSWFDWPDFNFSDMFDVGGIDV